MTAAMSATRKRAAPVMANVVSKKARFAETSSIASSTPSAPFTTPSIAGTSMTSASSSKRAKVHLCDFEGCGKAYDRPIRLETHKRSHNHERPFVCEEEGCDKNFMRLEHLRAHVQAKHTDERRYICTFKVAGTGDGGEELECGRSFHTATKLRRHVAAHEEKSSTTCIWEGCGKIFRKQETLQRHIKADHLHEASFRCDHVISEGPVPDGEQPEECGETFATPSQLKAHRARAHTGNRFFCHICPYGLPSTTTGESPAPSTPGPVAFPTHGALQSHIKTSHPPSCESCGKVCESNRALKAHVDIAHAPLDERQRFPCEYAGCGRKFTKRGNLNVHFQTVHVKEKNFACGRHDLSGSKKVDGWDGVGCGACFGTKANLEEHVRTQHLELPTAYRRARKVKSEATTPSAMDFEESADAVDDGKALAMLTGHGYDEQRPIACLQKGCQWRFSRDYDLAQHLELTHGWNVDDINDTLAEKEALEGGDFWVGGAEAAVEEETETETELGDRLKGTLCLQPGQPQGEGVKSEEGMEGVVVDPALA